MVGMLSKKLRYETSSCGLALVAMANPQLEVSYLNFFDNIPANDYPVLVNGAVKAPIAHPNARISYANFYDNNPSNDFPMLAENPALAKVGSGVTTRHLNYYNFLDTNPYNDVVVVEPTVIAEPAWGAPAVSYANFYDANPFNDFATIVDDGWDEIDYRTYETVETVVPPAYPVEHVEVFQPPPIENRYFEYIP